MARQKITKRALKIALPVLVLAIAVLIAGYLQATKPHLEPAQPAEREWLISAVTAEIEDQQPEIVAFGEVVTERDVELRALVAGQVIETGDSFVDGGVVRAGDLLVRIDPFVYEAVVDERAAEVAEARAGLAETEAERIAQMATVEEMQVQLRLREREVNRRRDLIERGVVSEKTLDDARMARSEQIRATAVSESQLDVLSARITRQQAAITRASVALRRARRDLEHTRLLAPFEGYLTETAAAIGKQLGVGDRVARLLDIGRLDARFHLSDAEYGRLVSSPEGLSGRPVRVHWRVGAESFAYDAEIVRTSGEVDPASGGITLYARIKLDAWRTPLRPGAFVEVHVPDRTYRRAVRLPEMALVGGDTIFAVVGERLEPRSVDLLLRVDNEIIVTGEITDGERIATTRFPEIGPGVKVRVR